MQQEQRIYSADWIFDGLGNALQNHCLVSDEKGKIIDLKPKTDQNEQITTHFEGALCPGFVNAHCHLELSHLKGKIDSGSGLIEFLKKVVTLREVDQELIYRRIEEEDRYMYEQGIVAVGDISNGTDTAAIKSKSDIQYYTFIELFDFCQDGLAENNWANGLKIYEQIAGSKSIVPHSPYTVSKTLFNLISSYSEGGVSSIHNQEMTEENDLHSSGSASLEAFLNIFGFRYPDYIGGESSAMDFLIQEFRTKGNMILVHNTQSKKSDIQAAQSHFKDCFWVSCPNANLYIENRLPDYSLFINSSAKLCIGTDSLSSNWKLSVLEEIKTIKKYNSYISSKNLIQWATSNGAQALGFDHKLGSFEIGKSPGINHLNSLDETGEIQQDCQITKVV